MCFAQSQGICPQRAVPASCRQHRVLPQNQTHIPLTGGKWHFIFCLINLHVGSLDLSMSLTAVVWTSFFALHSYSFYL